MQGRGWNVGFSHESLNGDWMGQAIGPKIWGSYEWHRKKKQKTVGPGCGQSLSRSVRVISEHQYALTFRQGSLTNTLAGGMSTRWPCSWLLSNLSSITGLDVNQIRDPIYLPTIYTRNRAIIPCVRLLLKLRDFGHSALRAASVTSFSNDWLRAPRESKYFLLFFFFVQSAKNIKYIGDQMNRLGGVIVLWLSLRF